MSIPIDTEVSSNIAGSSVALISAVLGVFEFLANRKSRTLRQRLELRKLSLEIAALERDVRAELKEDSLPTWSRKANNDSALGRYSKEESPSAFTRGNFPCLVGFHYLNCRVALFACLIWDGA